jgi:hypothetical protein
MGDIIYIEQFLERAYQAHFVHCNLVGFFQPTHGRPVQDDTNYTTLVQTETSLKAMGYTVVFITLETGILC